MPVSSAVVKAMAMTRAWRGNLVAVPPTRRRPSDDELLDAARDVFAEVGYHAARVASIADLAESTKPTLYAHFGSKEVMYVRVVEREIATLRDQLFVVYDKIDAGILDSRVEAAVDAEMSYAATHPNGFRVLMSASDPMSPAAELIEHAYREFTRRIAELIDARASRGGREPNPESTTIAAMIVATSQAAAKQALLVEGLEPARVTEIVTAFIRAGLKAATTLK